MKEIYNVKTHVYKNRVLIVPKTSVFGLQVKEGRSIQYFVFKKDNKVYLTFDEKKLRLYKKDNKNLKLGHFKAYKSKYCVLSIPLRFFFSKKLENGKEVEVILYETNDPDLYEIRINIIKEEGGDEE